MIASGARGPPCFVLRSFRGLLKTTQSDTRVLLYAIVESCTTPRLLHLRLLPGHLPPLPLQLFLDSFFLPLCPLHICRPDLRALHMLLSASLPAHPPSCCRSEGRPLTVLRVFACPSTRSLYSLPICAHRFGHAPVAHSSEPSQHSGSATSATAPSPSPSGVREAHRISHRLLDC